MLSLLKERVNPSPDRKIIKLVSSTTTFSVKENLGVLVVVLALELRVKGLYRLVDGKQKVAH